MAQTFTIGHVAKATGVAAKTIRYYEGIGVLPAPSRTASGYRRYDEPGVLQVRFIRRARALGLPLRHLKALTATLKQAKPDVARAAHHPIPACADPRGYWTVLLMHVNAAVASKGSAASVRAAMQGVPKIEHNLVAEIKNTAH